jgi:hypothetical protein
LTFQITADRRRLQLDWRDTTMQQQQRGRLIIFYAEFDFVVSPPRGKTESRRRWRWTSCAMTMAERERKKETMLYCNETSAPLFGEREKERERKKEREKEREREREREKERERQRRKLNLHKSCERNVSQQSGTRFAKCKLVMSIKE